jgi:hypothetical protein
MTTVSSSRPSSRWAPALLAAIAAAVLGGTSVSAHRLDELLQAARIAVEPGHVALELSLTPGAAVAESVIREIDADRNGNFSEVEKQAYAAGALGALVLRLDDEPPLRMSMSASAVPDAAALRTGDGVIVLRAVSEVAPLPAGSHRLFFRNEHAPAHTVYLANALVPDSDRVAITGQQRDGDQRALTIEFAITPETAESSSRPWVGLGVVLAFAVVARVAVRGTP